MRMIFGDTKFVNCIIKQQFGNNVEVAIGSIDENTVWNWLIKNADKPLTFIDNNGDNSLTYRDYRIKSVGSRRSEYYFLRMLWEEEFNYYYPVNFITIDIEVFA